MIMTVNSKFNSIEQMLKQIVKLDVDFPKITLSMKAFGVQSYHNISRYTTQKGFTSLLSNGNHIPLFDVDDCDDYDGLRNSFSESQQEYKDVNGKSLSNIYVVSDNIKSYRLFCFSEVSFKTYLQLMADNYDYLDWGFIRATIIRGKGTLRSPLSDKIGRMPQEIIDCLESYFVPIPLEKMEEVIYDTSNAKKYLMILLGEKEIVKWGDNH
jgi:hypothetical protein